VWRSNTQRLALRPEPAMANPPTHWSNTIKALPVLLWLMAALPGSVQAAGEVPAFKDTVIARFNDQDQTMMLERIDAALKSGKEGETLAWQNDKTGASGTVTALNRLTWDGLDCRRVKITNRFKSSTGEGVYRFCEKPKGSWKLVGPDASGS
jgi:surface antigen